MTRHQKITLAILAAAAAVVMLVLAGITATLLLSPSASAAVTPAPAQLLPLAVDAAATPAATASPGATSAPTQPPPPTATGTRVVVVTVPPSPSPTLANCANTITNFGASGLLTDDEVKQYLRNTLPADHLDNCRSIEYVPRRAEMHDVPLSGSFLPIYREIHVFSDDTQPLNAQQILGTLVHEIGHNVHYNIRRNAFELDVRWAKLHRQSQESFQQSGVGFVSNYARLNKFEDFSESYRTYVQEPETLRRLNLDKYEYMRQDVFNGREYPP